MPYQIKEATWRKFDRLIAQGHTKKEAMRKCGIRSYQTILNRENGLKDTPDKREERKEAWVEVNIPDPLRYEELSETAKRGWDDFQFFREHYLGRTTVPWQSMAAQEVIKYLGTEDKEYVVCNMPPGGGKTTTFTHDIVCWLIVRDRSIRVQLGHRVHASAKQYSRRLKTTLERTDPMVGARGVVSQDYGRFKPVAADLWRGDEFIVEQYDSRKTIEKEPTVVAHGQDSGFLGGRFDFIVWDDLVHRKNMKMVESREQWQEGGTQEAESRLEPGGALFLIGQRLGADDGYRFALDLKDVPDDEDDEEAEGTRKYHHVIYKAHYDDKCEGDHKRSAKPYPEGCLLDPVRLPWRELRRQKANNPRIFEVTYQQEDTDPANQLVTLLDIRGGIDPRTGEELPGCEERERRLLQLPDYFSGHHLSIVTVDPSPTKWWAIQWWVYQVNTEYRILMDIEKAQLRADDFLDLVGDRYTGLMEDWATRAKSMGLPIHYLIVEANGAQRFMLQTHFIRSWLARNNISLIPHQTNINKADPEYGVQTIARAYRQGLVRFPMDLPSSSRMKSNYLISELLKWPEGATDDQVMAHWFLEYHLPNLKFEFDTPIRSRRPSWAGKLPGELTA